ncbi:4Fe-4S dicluster domain-containing protein [Nocardioides sp.]|nr:4Fe-4S dicluster domain-containing protein [Nocardioides sp.]
MVRIRQAKIERIADSLPPSRLIRAEFLVDAEGYNHVYGLPLKAAELAEAIGQHVGKRMLYIHPDECVGCGACEPVCPQETIFNQDDVPDETAEFTRINAEFFGDVGSPGGASSTDLSDHDHPAVAAAAVG